MQKIRKFRLVQRLLAPETAADNPATLRFGDALKMDYMGSVEYEYGAFSDFLARMHALNCPEDRRSFWQRRVLGHPAPASQLQFARAKIKGVFVNIAFDTTRHTLEQVIEEITAIAKGRDHLKAPARFPPSELDRSNGRSPVAWAEIKENVIWSLEDLGHLGNWLSNTAAHVAEGVFAIRST